MKSKKKITPNSKAMELNAVLNEVGGAVWIDIKKRKPKANRRVLCSNSEDKWVVAGHRATNGLWYNQFQDKHSDTDIIPTHWMPLPKAARV